jgi:hypothetical protein
VTALAASPRRYLLDTGIVLIFQKTGHLEALTLATRTVNILLVEEVYDEVTEPRNDKHKEAASAAKTTLDDSDAEVVSILLGSPVADTYSALRGGKQSATANVGESASIAYAAHNRDVVFVTNDRAASFLALRELRGRTMTFHTLTVLVDDRAMVRHRAKEVVDAIPGVKDLWAVRPLWWDDWVLGV